MNLLPFERKDFKVFKRFRCRTNPDEGINPYERSVDELLKYGVINLDKPKGPTSHQVVKWVSKILSVKKAGHGGTLDPNVSGILPIGLNKSTRVLRVFLLGGKEYVCEMRIHKSFEKKKLKNVLNNFVGVINQLPPIKSSVKRVWRKRRIYYIDLMEIVDKNVLFKVGCEAGTYIRKLCTDIGEELGTGAHMKNLRRTKASSFKEETNLVSLQDLQDAVALYNEEKNDELLRKCVLPVEESVKHLKKVWIDDKAVNALCHGAQLMLPGVCKMHERINKGETVCMMSLKDELVGLGESLMNSEEMKNRKKGRCVKTDAIIMSTDFYE